MTTIDNLTDHQRLLIAKAAWESNPQRVPFDVASGPDVPNVIRDAFAAVRAYEEMR